MSTIIEQPIRDLMSQSFLDYAMSVITGRALPDCRDGLKPVHRRILFAMHEAGNTHNKAYKKSARMVGDVIGKYHPHGDVSVYDAAVRMAQPFSMSQLLIDGQGNFGSIDGDSPAAMRYTEMRLSKLASEFFSDINKETVAWRENYDGSEKEPAVLPSPFPNLLVNGVDGIAVGMASSIPPHNFRGVLEATLLIMENSEASTSELVSVLKAPDFPTGALVHGLDGFADAIESGRGRVKLRSKWHEEDRGRGATAIVIDEIPYQVNKSNLVSKIAELVGDKKLQDIAAMRDESSKEGVRIWIGLKKDASAEAVFAELASMTEVEVSVNYNCVVLVDGKPQQLGLRSIIQEWIAFREEVVLARHVWERKQALARLHILAGYMAALSMLDAVISTIREASSPADAKSKLMTLLAIDEVQAQAVLDLRLQKLTGMELESIREEHVEFTNKVATLTGIIESPERIRSVIRGELTDLIRRFGEERRTEIGHGISDITREDLIPREDVLLAMTRGGYIKRMPANALERQNRGTRGKKAMEIGGEDAIDFMKKVHSHDSLMVFAKSGQVFGIKAYRVPELSMSQKGRHIRNVIEGLDQEVHAVLALPERDPTVSVLTVTREGKVKRSALADYDSATRLGGVRGVGLEDGDELIGAYTVRDNDHIILISTTGSAIRFEASEVRDMGRTAAGVRGMRLEAGEKIVGAAIVTNGADPSMYLLCVGEQGVGKRTAVSEFRAQGRAGGGMVAFKPNTKTGPLVAAMAVYVSDDLIMFASNGVSNRIRVGDVRETGRDASGVLLMNLDAGAKLVSVTTAVHTETADADAEGTSEEEASGAS